MAGHAFPPSIPRSPPHNAPARLLAPQLHPQLFLTFCSCRPGPRRRHPSKRTCAAPGPCFRPRADPATSTVQDTALAEARLRAAFVSLDAFCATDVLQQPCPTSRSPPQALARPTPPSHAFGLVAYPVSFSCLREASTASPPARASVSEPGAEQRADSAVHLARLGELSAARRALLSEPLVLGDHATLQQLRDPNRRPCQPHAPAEPALLSWLAEAPVALPAPALLTICVAPAEVLPPAPLDLQPTSRVCSSTMPTPPKHSAASRCC